MLALFSTAPARPRTPPTARETDCNYFTATRHPLPCLVFLLPLLILYEACVLNLGESDPDALRNGADAWLHGSLRWLGLHEHYWAPALLVFGMGWWCWIRRSDRPSDVSGICIGMAIESVFAALGLWLISRTLRPLLGGLGIALDCAAPPVDMNTANLISYLGAGIYEEVLFRLLLFTGLCWGIRQLGLPAPVVLILAMAAGAAAFAGAHHVGPCGEPFDNYVFAFRCAAGLYFTLIYLLRGFGVAVGAHACYDVFVGLAFTV
jgi:membrane protease YdiL (CAAX protease family)